MEVGKMRVEPKTIGIAAVTHNHYAKSSMPFTWQTDRFIWIALGQAYS